MATTEDDFAQTWKDAIGAEAQTGAQPEGQTDKASFNTKPMAVASPGATRLPITADMTPEQQYAAIWQNEQNGFYGDEMVNPAPLPVDPTAGAPAAPAADASQAADDYRLPVPMNKEQFMSERYKHWDSGEVSKQVKPYWTFEEYEDAWYKSDDSKLVNRKLRAGKTPAASTQTAPAPATPATTAAPPAPVAPVAPASQVMQPAAMPAIEDRFA